MLAIINIILGGFSLSFVGVFANPAMKLTLFCISVVWVCSLLSCAVWVGLSFLKEDFGSIWPVKVCSFVAVVRRAGLSWCAVQILRTTATLSTTALFLPLMGKLMAVFDCETEWLTTSWKCFEGSHLGMVLGATIIVVLFTVFSLIGTPALRNHSCAFFT